MDKEQLPIIISPPKTGSTSLWRAVMLKYDPRQRDYMKFAPRNQHWSYKRKLNEGHAKDSDRFVLLIRNPYSRILSIYNYIIRGYVSALVNYRGDFDDFLNNHCKQIVHPLTSFVEGCANYDVIRYETYASDVKRIFDIDIDQYDHVGHGNNKKPVQVDNAINQMDARHIKLINQYFYDDFITFGYEMVGE